MKKLLYQYSIISKYIPSSCISNLGLILFWLGIFLLLSLANCKNEKVEENNSIASQSLILGQWSSNALNFGKLDLANDERNEYLFLLGGMGTFFEKMTIEFFEDGIAKDSYQLCRQLPNEEEPYKEFGEYELRANGKRLVIYNLKTREQLNIELEKLSQDTMQWRIPFCDLVKFGGQDISSKWKEEIPSFATYITFKRL